MKQGRPATPGKVTSGVSRCGNGGRGWRYWTRVDGVTTWGPQCTTEEEAEHDRESAMRGRPPKKLTQEQRRRLGTCLCCERPRAQGRMKCPHHLREANARGERLRRAHGQLPRAEFLRTAHRPAWDIGRKHTLIEMDARFAAHPTCPACILRHDPALPCEYPLRAVLYGGRRGVD